MPVWLLLLRRVDVEKPHPDALVFCDHVECVAINDVGYSPLECLGVGGKREQESRCHKQTQGQADCSRLQDTPSSDLFGITPCRRWLSPLHVLYSLHHRHLHSIRGLAPPLF